MTKYQVSVVWISLFNHLVYFNSVEQFFCNLFWIQKLFYIFTMCKVVWYFLVKGFFIIFEILKRRDFGKYFCQNNSENTRGKNDEVKICISTTKKYEGGLKNPYSLLSTSSVTCKKVGGILSLFTITIESIFLSKEEFFWGFVVKFLLKTYQKLPGFGV